MSWPPAAIPRRWRSSPGRRRSSRETCSSRTTPDWHSSSRSRSTGGWDAVDAVFADLPRSTEQVLHPEKYEAREAPIDVNHRRGPRDGPRDGLERDRSRTRSASSRSASGCARPARRPHRRHGRGGLGRRSSGRPRWPERGVGRRDAHRLGHDGRRRRVRSGRGGRDRRGRRARAVLPGAGGTTRWFVVASDADDARRR